MSTVTAGQFSASTRIVIFMAIIAGLFLGRELLIPFALAMFISVLLHPLVERLRRLGLPHLLSVSITTMLTGAVLLGLSVLVIGQVIDLTNQLPDYRENLKAKVRDIRPSGEGSLARLTGTFSELKAELRQSPTTQTTQSTAVDDASALPTSLPATMPTTQATETPVKVEVVNQESNFGDMVLGMLIPLMSPLGTAAITALLVIFFLLYGDDMRGRLITIAGMRRISITTSAVDESVTRISRFMRMQALSALFYAAMVTAMLLVLGVPNAILWGVLGFILRFVPYVGPWIAAIGPSIIAIAVFPGWGTPLIVICGFVVIETTTNLVIEPWLWGSGTGVTPLGVVICVIFWGWIWGAIGMVLAVPITACMVVLGKHVSAFSVLHRLFGADVAVPDVGRLYQRALAGDERYVAEIVRSAHKPPGPAEEGPGKVAVPETAASREVSALDTLILPAISELKHDHSSGAISDEVATRTLAVLDEAIPASPEPEGVQPALLLLAVQTPADDLAAKAIAHVTRSREVPTSVLSSEMLANEAADAVAKSNARWIALVQVMPTSSQHERRLLKAIEQRDERKRMVFIVHPGESAQSHTSDNDDPTHRMQSAARFIERIVELSMIKPDVNAQPATPSSATPSSAPPKSTLATRSKQLKSSS